MKHLSTKSESRTSGVKELYMMTPSESSYSVVGSTSKTVSASSGNGLYRFYAKDNAGNASATYYVYYDTSLPTITLKNSSGATITNGYTNTAFNCTASDTGSGVSYLQYKTPSNNSWLTYYSGTNLGTSSANGLYQFRAVDKAGNISAAKTITFDTTKPFGTIYDENTAVSSGGATKASYIKFEASDAHSGVKTIYVKKPNTTAYTTYTAGTQFTTNGTYSFYCIDSAGNTSVTYTATLDIPRPCFLAIRLRSTKQPRMTLP